jgi:DNA polymerase-3 subunit delta'
VSFDDFSGDRSITARLQLSLKRGRLAHAYLFTGSRGTGKEEMATTLAQALNCEKSNDDACGKCVSCRTIAEKKHPDVYWVRPESKSRKIDVEQIRDFERAVSLKSGGGRMKVGIVVDADCMNESASNAFLKTLEEPPDRTLILLLTSEPQRLLATILSRCLRISFGASRSTERTPEQERTLALLAGFAPAPSRGVVDVYKLHAALTKLFAEMRAAIEEANADDGDEERARQLDKEAREKLEEERTARLEGEYRGARERVLEELYTWFGDALLCVAGAEESALAHADRAEDVRRAAAGLTYERALSQLEAVEGIRDALSRNITEPFALEVGLLKLI